MFNNKKKILTLNFVCKLLKDKKKKIVFTNGCFDILHSGHISILKFSKKKGDLLIVALNSDKSIKKIKNKKPYFSFKERASTLAEIESVDYIIKMNESNPKKIIQVIKPNFHIKGGDYKAKDLEEYNVAKSIKCKIIIFRIKNKISSSRFYAN
jgi:rfaE bifunctional protein nucleotidyltransferase chain/domain